MHINRHRQTMKNIQRYDYISGTNSTHKYAKPCLFIQ